MGGYDSFSQGGSSKHPKLPSHTETLETGSKEYFLPGRRKACFTEEERHGVTLEPLSGVGDLDGKYVIG